MAIKRYVGLGKESTYGTAVAATRYAEAVALLKPNQNWIIPPPVAMRSFQKRNLGPYRMRGTIGDFSIEPENIIGELLLGVFGSVTTTNPATGVYLHEFKPADTLPSYTLRSGVEQTERVLPGCLLNSLTIRYPHDSNIKAKAEVFSGFLETKTSLATPTLSALQPLVFNNSSNVLTIAAVDKKDIIYDLEITLKNNIPFERGDLSGRTFSKKRYGELEVIGKFSAYFDNTTEFDRFIAGTEFDLDIKAFGPTISGGHSYELLQSLKKCVYLQDTTPDVKPINEPLVIDAPFKAFYNSSLGYEALAQLKNAIPSY